MKAHLRENSGVDVKGEGQVILDQVLARHAQVERVPACRSMRYTGSVRVRVRVHVQTGTGV
jgi:hypothetical protein